MWALGDGKQPFHSFRGKSPVIGKVMDGEVERGRYYEKPFPIQNTSRLGSNPKRVLTVFYCLTDENRLASAKGNVGIATVHQEVYAVAFVPVAPDVFAIGEERPKVGGVFLFRQLARPELNDRPDGAGLRDQFDELEDVGFHQVKTKNKAPQILKCCAGYRP